MHARLEQKTQMAQLLNHPYEEWNNLKHNSVISNISKYLREKIKIQEIKSNFLSVFIPKNVSSNNAG